MKRLLLGSLLSAIALMIWGFVFWAGGGAAMGFSSLDVEAEQAVMSALAEHIPETGAYVLPDPETTSLEEWTARHLAGPLAFLHVTRAGTDPMSPRVYVLGFLHMFIVSFLIGLGMIRVLSPSTSYIRRIGFGGAVGVVVAFWSNLSDPIWFYEPWPYHLTTSLYDLVSFLIIGAVLGKIVRP
ncbi:MAG: hypothetical protein JJ896_07315 [Rhodothermales bacterium]|nr:hypothetical protein [Rhodothermales bacterium]MBO6779447.1 hypothetical protein [Rhodothermales bacterium]